MSSSLWTSELQRQADLSRDFPAMLDVALQVISRIPQKVHVVFGPMSTGGAGSWEANIDRHRRTVQHFSECGLGVFDQAPLKNGMRRIAARRTYGEYPWFILEEFYGPLLETGEIDIIFFLPEWHTSAGASWEHRKAQALSIHTEYLGDDFLQTIYK